MKTQLAVKAPKLKPPRGESKGKGGEKGKAKGKGKRERKRQRDSANNSEQPAKRQKPRTSDKDHKGVSICKYYQWGSCRKGKNCPDRHVCNGKLANGKICLENHKSMDCTKCVWE